MKNICLFNSNLEWGGGEKWHFETALSLKSQGNKVFIVTGKKSKLARKLENKSVSLIQFKISKLSFLNPFKIISFYSFLKKNKIETLILNLPQDAKFAGLAGFCAGVTKIIYRRGMNHPIKASLINKLVYNIFITDFIANSREVKKSIYKNIKGLKNKIHILYNSVDLNEIPPNKNQYDKLILGNLGRLVEQKGQKYLIEVAKHLVTENLNFEIQIAGSGPLEKELSSLIELENLQDKVKLVGHVDTDQFLKKVDFYIFTSLFEGLSNSLLEALLYKKTIIAFDTASNYEVITNGYNGILIPPFDTQLMAKYILLLAKSPETTKVFNTNGLLLLQAKFDRKRSISKLNEII